MERLRASGYGFMSLLALLVLVGSVLVQRPASAATSDPYVNRQWGLAKIQAERAWPIANGTGAIIAVVDTGVDFNHPDLASKLIYYPDADFVEPNGTCTGRRDQRTCVQDGAQDQNGHGTHVAGIAAAITNNGTGVAGVAPGARILPVRVLDAEGSGTSDQIAAGIRYAADKGAHVINLSLGFLSGVGEVVKVIGELDGVYAAIEYAHSKGAVVLFAAGNDSVPLCAEPSAAPGVICVGSTDSRDLRSWFSNGDATLMKNYLVAPGGDGLTCEGDIFATYQTTLAQSSCSPQAGYEALAGTSMATPHVAGVAALLAGKGLDRARIMSCLLATTDDLGTPGRDPIFGYGRLNAYKAVSSSC
ncbi:MAG TPA: S8 family peptidase [Herpetosiphonaceae bacterium]